MNEWILKTAFKDDASWGSWCKENVVLCARSVELRLPRSLHPGDATQIVLQEAAEGFRPETHADINLAIDGCEEDGPNHYRLLATCKGTPRDSV